MTSDASSTGLTILSTSTQSLSTLTLSSLVSSSQSSYLSTSSEYHSTETHSSSVAGPISTSSASLPSERGAQWLREQNAYAMRTMLGVEPDPSVSDDTEAEPEPCGFSTSLMVEGQVSVGLVLSCTVTLNIQEASLPAASLNT